MKIAILGPGGVGGLLAGALERSGEDVTVVARESTTNVIAEHGVRISSVKFGDFVAHPSALPRLSEPVDALIVATKAAGLESALERIDAVPGIVLPLLNGLDHIAVLRERFGAERVLAGTIRVEADRPEQGVVVHTSPFLLIEMASRYESAAAPMQALAQALDGAGVSARGDWPIAPASEAQVMWSKLVRLNALACTTSAYDKLLGEIRDTPVLRADLVGAMEEAAAAGRADGADVDAEKAIAELDRAHATLGSSMQRDIAAGRPPELDAIPGSVLRAASRHGLKCPTIERL
ncbi:MAG TPA: 2-dehydropantoate 2-reductase, partial [Solirubrobacteraceae bacterium]|nr:2-dehydropantoate 2-reductase [Solirubrobacteraceae bacterium]